MAPAGTAPAGLDIDENAGASPDEIDFAAIERLMTSKYTAELVDRHVAAVRKVCKTSKNGFLLKHLEPLIDLLRLVVKRFVEGQRQFAQAICDFIRVAANPFVSCKSSDMITYGHNLLSFLKSLMAVLPHALPPTEEEIPPDGDEEAKGIFNHNRVMNERIRIELAHMLACWSRYGLDEDSVELRPNQPLIQAVADAGTPNLRILKQAQVVDSLSQAFRVEDCAECVVITLGAIRDMSLYRPLARQITNCGLISNLVHVIRVNLLGSDVLLVAAEVLWNVMELDWEGAAEATGQEETIESFRDFMSAILTRGYRFKDKIFRNDMMVLLMYISKRPENRPLFASTGLMALLLYHAVTDAQRKELKEIGAVDALMPFMRATGLQGDENQLDGHVPITSSQEDMEFRTLHWGTLARCCSSEACAEVANQMGLIPMLLTYLDASLPAEQRQWTQEQRRKVQLEALSALFQLVQHMPDVFLEAGGNAAAMQLLQATRSREVQRKCLHLLQVAVRMRPAFAEELGRLGAVGALIEIFSDKDNSMSSRQLCATILARICSKHPENCREFRKKDGVEAIREEVVYRRDETTENHLFYTICVVDCVWSAVVGTRKNEVRFLDAGGLFALLDVLEVAPLLLKRQIIGCLADLMQYRKAAKLLTQWNSQVTMKGALKILLELWQNEQEKAGSTGPDGVIRDLDRPLNPILQAEPAPIGGENAFASLGSSSRPQSGESDNSVGEGRSSRASLKLQQARSYAEAFTARTTATSGFLGGLSATAPSQGHRTQARGPTFVGGPGAVAHLVSGGREADTAANPAHEVVEQRDCRAKIYAILACIGVECTETLSISERQDVELAKLYPDCVRLETWISVKENLERKGIKPVGADRKWIDDSLAEGMEKTTQAKNMQQKLADERRNEEYASLNRFYDDIRSRAQFRKHTGKDSTSTEFLGRYGGSNLA